MKAKIISILNSKLVKNSAWLLILKFMSTVVPMLTIPYITRMLGAEEYGTFSIALNWVLYFQVIVEYGFGLTGARKVALNNTDNDVQNLFNNIISARILLFIFSLIIMNIICLAFRVDINIYICMNILFFMVFGTSIQLVWLFQGKQDMKFITITDSIARIVSVILIFIFIKKPSDVYIYCVFYSITTFLSSIISQIVVRKKYGLHFKFSNFKSIKAELIDGKELFASACATKIFSGVGVTILGFITTKSVVGIYSAISKIPLVLTYIFAPISQALYPYSSEQFAKHSTIALKKIKKISLPIIIFNLILSMIIIVFRNILILKIFGNEYAKYSILLIPLILQFVFAVINNFLGIQILVASGNQKAYSKVFIIDCLIMLLLNLIFGYFYNIYGVAMANPIGELILTCLLLLEVNKYKKKYI